MFAFHNLIAFLTPFGHLAFLKCPRFIVSVYRVLSSFPYFLWTVWTACIFEVSTLIVSNNGAFKVSGQSGHLFLKFIVHSKYFILIFFFFFRCILMTFYFTVQSVQRLQEHHQHCKKNGHLEKMQSVQSVQSVQNNKTQSLLNLPVCLLPFFFVAFTS